MLQVIFRNNILLHQSQHFVQDQQIAFSSRQYFLGKADPVTDVLDLLLLLFLR